MAGLRFLQLTQSFSAPSWGNIGLLYYSHEVPSGLVDQKPVLSSGRDVYSPWRGTGVARLRVLIFSQESTTPKLTAQEDVLWMACVITQLPLSCSPMMMSILKHLTAPIKEASYFSRQCRASQTPLNLCVSSSEASGLSLLTFPGLAKVRETYRGVSGIQHWETYFSSNHTQSCQSFSQIWFFFFFGLTGIFFHDSCVKYFVKC